MARTVDINTPPAGGFLDGGWYWDPSVKQARQYYQGKFGPPGDAGANWWTKGSTPQSGSSSQQAQGPVDPLQQVNQSIQDSFQKLQNEVVAKFGQYQAGKPFRVDEVLAEKTKNAKEQIDPYYNQILGDYLTGVERKIQRGRDDTKEILGELNASTASYSKQSEDTLVSALDQANQGFADSGLFGSGAQLSAEGKLKEATGSNLADYMRVASGKQRQAQTNLTRSLEDINLGRTQDVSNIERNRYTDVANRAGQLTKEAGQQYIQGFQQTLPTELQSASGFDMLKSLGIYS